MDLFLKQTQKYFQVLFECLVTQFWHNVKVVTFLHGVEGHSGGSLRLCPKSKNMYELNVAVEVSVGGWMNIPMSSFLGFTVNVCRLSLQQ